MKMKHQSLLAKHLVTGHVYRRENLLPYSKAVDRDLKRLVNHNILTKVKPHLYYKPKESRYGTLPPDNERLVSAFLRDERFLMFSWNDYNSLGLELTQLYKQYVVYNYKRHGKFTLANITFDFRRQARGFPNNITPEFLLVDLVNNLNKLSENPTLIKIQIQKQLKRFDQKKVSTAAKRYGKVSTQKFFRGLCH